MGRDLYWNLIRNSNSFIVTNRLTNGGRLTNDPFSATSRHCLANCGLVRQAGVSISQNGNNGKLWTVAKTASTWKNKPASYANFGFNPAAVRGSKALKVTYPWFSTFGFFDFFGFFWIFFGICVDVL
jgi:hypothetical protein